MPPRLDANWTKDHIDCYSRYWIYPRSDDELGGWIDDAYNARTTRNKLINNSQSMMRYNSKCRIHDITH